MDEGQLEQDGKGCLALWRAVLLRSRDDCLLGLDHKKERENNRIILNTPMGAFLRALDARQYLDAKNWKLGVICHDADVSKFQYLCYAWRTINEFDETTTIRVKPHVLVEGYSYAKGAEVKIPSMIERYARALAAWNKDYRAPAVLWNDGPVSTPVVIRSRFRDAA